MQYLPVAGLPVVGAPDSMNGVAPEGAVVTPAFNAMLGNMPRRATSTCR
jgi:hypothetical protein